MIIRRIFAAFPRAVQRFFIRRSLAHIQYHRAFLRAQHIEDQRLERVLERREMTLRSDIRRLDLDSLRDGLSGK